MRKHWLIRAALVIATTATPALAQSKLDFALLAADAMTRATDVYTTKQDAASHATREKFLPVYLVGNQGRFLGFEAATTETIWQGSRFLHRHHHPRLGDVITIVDIAAVSFTNWHNMNLIPGKRRK